MKKLLYLIGALCTLTSTIHGNGFFGTETVSSAIDIKGFDKMQTVGDSTYIFDFKGANKMPKGVTAQFTGTIITPQGKFQTTLNDKAVLDLARKKMRVVTGKLIINVPDPEGFSSQKYEFREKGKYVLESEPEGEATRLTCPGKVCKLTIDLSKQLPGYKDIGKISLKPIKKKKKKH